MDCPFSIVLLELDNAPVVKSKPSVTPSGVGPTNQ
jgi:hypothetical protein